MEVRSIYRGARISAFKAREVTREIQGLPASAALDILTFSPKKAAVMISKTLRSAIANAENNNDLRANVLVVKEATVGEGPTMRRFRARARGSASPILKRTSHIRIILTDEVAIPERRSAGKGQKARTARPAPARAAARPVATGRPGGAGPTPAAAAAAAATVETIEPVAPAAAAPGEPATPASPTAPASTGAAETPAAAATEPRPGEDAPAS